MKYGYIPIAPIISELQAQLKTMVKMGKFDEGDCYQYAIQCIRKIGCTEYETSEEIIEIVKHKAAIPKHFYLFEDVRLAEPTNLMFPLNTTPSEVTKNFNWNGDVFYIGPSLKPVDNTTISYCEKSFYNPSCSSIGFTFKIPPGVISCDLKECKLYIKYQGLKRDEKGNYLMQDEENGIEAVKNFILQECLKEDYLLGKVPKYMYDGIKNDFDLSLSNAQNALLALGPAEINSLVDQDRRKLDRFKLR